VASEVNYARTGDVHIAYRVFGEGPRDIVLIPGTLSHVELFWEFPINQYLLKRFTSFARVIVFDKRGQGLSDRVAEQTLEERIGDVRAVMDAAGSSRATIFGWSEGGPMSLMFSATYPERTSALIVCGSFASAKAEPWALSPSGGPGCFSESRVTGGRVFSSPSTRRAAATTRRSWSGSGGWSGPRRARERSWR
jgi:pimeloyl-ACP methyl ester carboxylesterase